MAFFNYVNPWPETTHWPLRCSAPGDGMPPSAVRRVDEPTSDFGPETPCSVWRVACGVWRVACGVWRHVLHMCPSTSLDQLPAAGSLSRRS
jgi:hypothetical protein